MTATIGASSLALEPKKQSAFAKAVKNVQKLKGKKQVKAAPEGTTKYKRGIILLKHIPHGFFEKEMRDYFKQFGHVLRIRLARSKKTGKSKGYAFIEFEFEEVAKIAAECMDGYLMYERLLKCEVVSDVNPNKIFSGRFMSEDNYPKLHARNKVREEQCKTKSEEEVKAFLQFRLRKLEEQNKKLAEMGIEYKFDTGLTINASPAVTKSERKIRKSEGLMPKFSPKLLRSKGRDSTIFQETPKFSPKSLKTTARDSSSNKHTEAPKSPPKSPKLVQKKSRKSSVQPIVAKSSPKLQQPTQVVRDPSPVKPETPKVSPKAVQKQVRDPSPKADTPKSSPNNKAVQKKSRKSSMKPEMPKFSPKLLRNKSRESTTNNKQEVPKFSPKLLRNKARESTANQEVSQPSPKLLKNKAARDSVSAKKSPKSVQKKARESTSKPELPKFSPKLLRSKTRDSIKK